MNELGIEQARQQLGEVIDRARIARQPTLITRQGKPAAVVVPVEWWNELDRAWDDGFVHLPDRRKNAAPASPARTPSED